MIYHLKGTLSEVSPTLAILECGGVGYAVQISLQTFTAISSAKEVKLFTHVVYSGLDGSQQLYGFHSREERSIFQLLISVSGVGGNTARLILGGMSIGEVVRVISDGEVAALKSVKGIGAKTAERIIVDLRDKLGDFASSTTAKALSGNAAEAIAALEVLGYQRKQTERLVNKLLQEQADASVEHLIKVALNKL